MKTPEERIRRAKARCARTYAALDAFAAGDPTLLLAYEKPRRKRREDPWDGEGQDAPPASGRVTNPPRTHPHPLDPKSEERARGSSGGGRQKSHTRSQTLPPDEQ